MLRPRSLRLRLAAWYFGSMALICAVAAAGYWFAIRVQLDEALDLGLRYRLVGLQRYLDSTEPGGPEVLASRLRDASILGELFVAYDDRGALIAVSDGLARHGLRPDPPADLGFDIRYVSAGRPEFRVRLAWQRIRSGDHNLVVGAADPQRKFEGILGAFGGVLLASMPVIFVAATAVGLWLGRRALAPVARITDDARAITERNLSARLAVPASQDELQQLSETLNGMLDRIERGVERMRRFTADASHELRAPMTLIYTAAQFALRRERSRDELVDSLQKILRESQRTTALIDDLLLLARGDEDKEAVAFAPVDAAGLARECAGQTAAMAEARHQRLVCDVAEGALPVLVHEAQLRRLLLILADNAIKYTPEGGTVTIGARRDGGGVVLEVSDTGRGLAPDELPHVFERFWRADKVRSREAGGAGLGLTIAAQIAERHGTRIEVRSEVRRGSVFSLRLPASGDRTG